MFVSPVRYRRHDDYPAARRARPYAAGRPAPSGNQVVEVAFPEALDQGGNGVPAVNERRALGIPGGAHRDRPGADPGYLHASPLGIAALAFTPCRPVEFPGRHAVIDAVHLRVS